jgi:hypothetical protein
MTHQVVLSDTAGLEHVCTEVWAPARSQPGDRKQEASGRAWAQVTAFRAPGEPNIAPVRKAAWCVTSIESSNIPLR